MKVSVRILFVFIFLVGPSKAFSQNKKIDSLLRELSIHKEKDTVRVNILYDLSFFYYRQDLDKAKAYNKETKALAKEIDFTKGIGKATYMQGVIEMAKSNFESSIEYFENAAQIFADNGLKKNIAACYNGKGVIYFSHSEYENALLNFKKARQVDEEVGIQRNIPNYITNIGNIYMKTGKYPEAMDSYKEALALYRKAKYTLGISSCLKNIAVIYQKQGNHPRALEYNNKALTLAEEMQDSLGISNSLNNMSLIYKSQQKYDKALELLEKSLAIQELIKNEARIAGIKNNIATIHIKKEEFETAIKFLNEALALNRKINSKSQIAECLNNLGNVHTSLKKHNLALNHFEEAKEINKEINNQAGLSYSYLGMADSYVDQKRYDEALPSVLKSIKIANKLELLDHLRDGHQLLSEIYQNEGGYKKAYESYLEYKKLSDSLFNKKNIEEITQLEYEHKYRRALDSANIRELELKQTVTATSQNLERSQRNLLLGVVVFLGVASLLGSIIFYLKLRNAKEKNRNILIEQKLLRSQMTPHFIFNSLSVLQGMILNKEEGKAVSYLSNFSKLLRTILENSRHKEVPLSEELLAIDHYMALQNQDVQPPYNYSLTIAPEIDKSAIKIPPMLIQPFVENAIEHAFTEKKEDKEINVELAFENEKLICTITDNGMGLDKKAIPTGRNKNSLATTITSERLRMLSKDFNAEGSLSIKDRKQFGEQGTLVTLVIPYKSELAG